MLPKRNASDRQPTLTHDMVPTAARANRRNRRLCPSRRLALGVILTPLSVLIALGLVQGGAVEGQRAPVTVTLTGSPTPTIPPVGATPTTPPVGPWPSALHRGVPRNRWPEIDAYLAYIHELARQPRTPDDPEAERRLREETERADKALREGPTFRQPMGSGYLILQRQPPPDGNRYSHAWSEQNGQNYLYIAPFVDKIYPQRSAVMVWEESTAPNFNGPKFVRYYAPLEVGLLRITAANGHRITLTADNGVTLIFDLDSRTFSQP